MMGDDNSKNASVGELFPAFTVAAVFLTAGFAFGYRMASSYAEDTQKIKDGIIAAQYKIIQQQQIEIARQEELLLLGEKTCL